MIGGTSPAALLHLSVPFFVLGLGLWCGVLLRSVPQRRWQEPRHWFKAGVCTAGVTIGMMPLAAIGGLLVAALLRA
ncbi:MAG: hypothetical protein JKY37_33895 [Nannocystaceae bacterium]|nr:hypothetical protein [Nannocystaceae bacterium]